MNEYVEKALGLFESGIPSKKVFLDDIWAPYRGKVFGDDQKTLKAVYHFVNTYDDLQKNKLSDDFKLLLQSENLEFLPEQCDVAIIHKMHNDLMGKMTKEHEDLVISRKALVESKIEYAKGLLRELSKELEDNDMHFALSDDFGLDTVIIYDRITNEEYDITLQELDD